MSAPRKITGRRSVIFLLTLVVLVALGIVWGRLLPRAVADNKVRDLGAGLAGMGTNVNQDFDVAVGVRNNGSAPVTFRVASLIDLPGYRNLTLDHLAVYETHDDITATTGWPPRKNGKGEKGSFVVHPFNGFVLGARQVVYIVYAMKSSRNGIYIAGGLHLTYSYRHLIGHSTAWAGGEDCVQDEPIVVNDCPTYKSDGQAAYDLLQKLSGD